MRVARRAKVPMLSSQGVLDRPFLRLCHPQRPLEAGRGAGHWARPPAAQSWLPTFLVFSHGPAEIPNYLSNRNKVSPLRSQLLSGYVLVCDTIYTSPIPAAPSRQMASWPHWVFGSLLPFTPPVLGLFAVLGPDGTGLGPIRGPSPPKVFPSLSHLENQELSQV